MQQDIVPQSVPAQSESPPLSAPVGQGQSLVYPAGTVIQPPRRRLFTHLVAIAGVVILVLFMGLGGWAFYKLRAKVDKLAVPTPVASDDVVTYTALNKSGIKLAVSSVTTTNLAVSGTLNASGQIIITPTARPASPTLGIIYLDSTDQILYFFDGTSFKPLEGPGAGSGQSLQSSKGVPGPPGAKGTVGAAGATGPAGPLGSNNCISGNCVSLQPTSPGTQEIGNINLAGNLAIDSGSQSIILGNVGGNARGAGAVDIQGSRSDPSQVAAGPDSVAIGIGNTAGTAAGSTGFAFGQNNTAVGIATPSNFGLAIGEGNTASGWDSMVYGFFSSSTETFTLAEGVDSHALGAESAAIGRLDVASAPQAEAYGYQNAASGYQSSAFGQRATSGGSHSIAFGGNIDFPIYALGDQAVAVGEFTRVGGNNSNAFGNGNIVGYPERVFTIPANGTTVTIAGGNFTAEYANGDAVVMVPNFDNATSDQFNARRTISAVTYNSGPNTTTFTLSSPIDAITTIGRIIDQLKAQRSGAYGVNNTVLANDAYALGEGITNNLQGSVQIGTSDATKATITSNGTISSVAAYALNGTNVLSKQGNGALLVGDNTGNSRGINSLDLQVSRTTGTQVASGDGSIAVGSNNTASTVNSVAFGTNNTASAAPLYNSNAVGSNNTATGTQYSNAFGSNNTASSPLYADAFGDSNTANNWNSTAFGLLNVASNVNTSAFGQLNTVSAQEASAFGRLNWANAFGATAFGVFNMSTAQSAAAFGNDNFTAGLFSSALGVTNDAYGGGSTAVGDSDSASGLYSAVFGTSSATGYPARAFTVPAGGTTVTIAGGNYTTEFVNGDTVVLSDHPFPPTPSFAAVNKTISAVTYNSGPNTTTITISSPIDGSTTAGEVVSTTRAQRSGVLGYSNAAVAADSYILGEGITNNIQGSVQIGTSDADKITIDANGRLGIDTATPGNLLSVGVLTTAAPTAQISVSTGGTTNSGIVVQDVASQSSGFLLQAQDSTGAALASIDYQGNLIVKNATINGHIISGGAALSGSNISANANCGTGCTVSITGNDIAGLITINTGTGAALGVQASVTFATAYTSGTAPLITITPVTVPATSNFPEYYYAATNSGFDLKSYNALTDSKTYTFSYHVIQ